MSHPLLTVTGLSRSFGGLMAVDGLTFAMATHEIVGLIGPNGSGKTTTLNLLSGFDSPTSGEIRIDATALSSAQPRAVFALGVARTFQAVRLFDSLTVAENVEVAALSLRRSQSHAQILQRVQRELTALDIADVAQILAGALPYGLRRRVEMARALVTDPLLVLLDEPAAGMSRRETEELQKRVSDVRSDRGAAFLVVEHDIQLIFDLCDRVVVLDMGRKIAEGSPEEVRSNPRVRESYIGDAES